MRHARAEDLEPIASMVTALRAIDGLTEKSPGSFYRRSRGFLHFHVHGDDMYADVKLTGDEFERVRVTTKAEQRKLVAAVRRALA